MHDLFPPLVAEAPEDGWVQPKRTTPRSMARSLYVAFEEASNLRDESDVRALDHLDTMAEEDLTTPQDLCIGHSPSFGALCSNDDSYMDSLVASDYNDASMDNAPMLRPCSHKPKRTLAKRSPQQGTPPCGAQSPCSSATPFGFPYWPTARPLFMWPFRHGPRMGMSSPLGGNPR